MSEFSHHRRKGELSEDCNCRCYLLQRAKWALSEEKYYTKWHGEKNKLVRGKAKDYNEFKEKAYKSSREKKEEIQVHLVGKINREIYKCITADIATDEVIITDERIEYIIKRRSEGFYEKFGKYFEEILKDPDYIFKDTKENTALVCKGFIDGGNYVNIVLRLVTSKDLLGYKNSIITAIGENEKRFTQRLRNNTPLYKKE